MVFKRERTSLGLNSFCVKIQSYMSGEQPCISAISRFLADVATFASGEELDQTRIIDKYYCALST